MAYLKIALADTEKQVVNLMEVICNSCLKNHFIVNTTNFADANSSTHDSYVANSITLAAPLIESCDDDYDYDNKTYELTRKGLNNLWFAQFVCTRYLNAVSIDLSHNNITRLAEYSLGKFASVRRLNISSNSIISVDMYAFYRPHEANDTISGPLDLVELDLSDNNLKSIPFESIVRLPGLDSLYMARNGITQISIGNKSNARRPSLLRFIDLSHNKISHVDLSIIEYMPNVTRIDLSHNRLVNLSWILTLRFYAFRIRRMDVEFILFANNKKSKCDIPLNSNYTTVPIMKYSACLISAAINNMSKIYWITELDNEFMFYNGSRLCSYLMAIVFIIILIVLISIGSVILFQMSQAEKARPTNNDSE